jgi:hypothetical protein
MVKKMLIGFIAFGFSIITLGCSLNEGTEELYKQENVLKIELISPKEIDTGEAFEVKALLSQVDGEVPELENIEFLIWKNGERDQMKRVQHENEGNGLYSIRTMVQEKGLYFVKVEANTVDSKVMPTKQFIVGTLSEEDIHSLPKQNEEQHHEGHH